jgi:signal peptidase II
VTGLEVLGVASVVVLVDQATKALAVRFLSPAANQGWWFGRSLSVPVLLGLWSLTLACTMLAIASATSPSHRLAGAALAVALGGATSNLLDRVGRRAVIDFITLGRWPAFNVADAAIVAGVVVAVGLVI